jgi:hypothetical protein
MMTTTHDLAAEFGVGLDALLDAADDMAANAMRAGRGHRAVYTTLVVGDGLANLAETAAAALRAHFRAASTR